MASSTRMSSLEMHGRSTTGRYVQAVFLLTPEEMQATLKANQWGHYVYGLCIPDGTVFYVGKGTAYRALDHAREADGGNQSFKSAFLRNLGSRLRYTIFLSAADDSYSAGVEAIILQQHSDSLLNIMPGSQLAIDEMHIPPSPLKRTKIMLAEMEQKTTATINRLYAEMVVLFGVDEADKIMLGAQTKQ